MSWKGPDKLDKLHQPKKLKKMGNKKDNAGSRRQFFSSLAAVKALAELAKTPVPDIVNMAYNETNIIFGEHYIIPS